jgi:hypothetical protein
LIVPEWILWRKVEALVVSFLFILGKLESSCFIATSALDGTMTNPELPRVQIHWAIYTASTVSTTASPLPSAVLDKVLMHIPPSMRSPEVYSSCEGSYF